MKRILLTTAAVAGIVGTASAADLSLRPVPVLPPPAYLPFYIALSAGGQLRDPATDPVGETTFRPGFLFSAAAGVRLGPFRIEGEYNKLDNKNDQLSVAALPPPLNGLRPATGNIEIDTFFANAAYDFDLSGTYLALLGRPFVSFGFGALQSSIHSLANDITSRGGAFIVNSTSNYIVAAQVKIGTAIPITDRLDIFADYRYMHGLESLTFLLQDGSFARPEVAFNIFELGARLNF